MSTASTPLSGSIHAIDARPSERDPGSHGADLAMEMQIAQSNGELPAAGGNQAGWSTAWGWLYSLPFVGPRP